MGALVAPFFLAACEPTGPAADALPATSAECYRIQPGTLSRHVTICEFSTLDDRQCVVALRSGMLQCSIRLEQLRGDQ